MKFNNDFECENCKWKQSVSVLDKNGDESLDWVPVDVTAVPVGWLLREYEDLVFELSEKEIELYKLKEAYLIAEAEIVNNTDFKALYGANNQKVRDSHVRNELSDMYEQKHSLGFSIDFIKNYIPLLREVIRSKKND